MKIVTRLLVWTPILVITLLIGALYVIESLTWSKERRDWLADQSEKTLGRRITIHESLRFRILRWQPFIEIKGLDLENPSWSRKKSALSFKRAYLQIHLTSLFQGRPTIKIFELESGFIDVENHDQHGSNWSFSAKNSEKKPPAPPEDTPKMVQDFINHLMVERAHIQDFRLFLGAGKNTEILHIQELDTQAFSNGGTTATAKAKLRIMKELAGTLRLIAMSKNLFNLNDTNGLIASFRSDAVDLDAHAQLRTSSEIRAKFKLLSKNLNQILDLVNLEFAKKLPILAAEGELKHASDALSVDLTSAQLGKTDLRGKANFNFAVTPMDISIFTRSEHTYFSDFGAFLLKKAAADLPSARAKKISENSSASAKKIFSNEKIDLNFTHSLHLNVDAETTHFHGEGKAQMIDHLRVKLLIGDGQLRLAPLIFGSKSGVISSFFHIDTKTNPYRISLHAAVDSLDLGVFLEPYLSDAPIGQAKIGRYPIRELFKGELFANVNVQSKGSSYAAVMGNIDGRLNASLQDGSFSALIMEALGLDLTESLGVLVAKKQNLRLECLVLDAQAIKGILTAKQALIATNDSNVRVHGLLDLRNEKLDLDIKTIARDFSIGSLNTPILVKGPLHKIKLDLDREKLLARLGLAVALGVVITPAASALALVEPGNGSTKVCQASQNKIAAIKNETKAFFAH